MPVVQHYTKTLYQFSELSDSAKENARNWWRDCMEPHDYADGVIEDAEACANILGITFDQSSYKTVGGQTRYEPDVRWQLHVQGSGASFVGTYCYAKGAHKAIRKHAPQDTILHSIADALMATQKGFQYKLRAVTNVSGYHPHSLSMDVDVTHDADEYKDIGDAEQAVRDALRRFADWIYKQIDEEYTYQSSDETIDENMECNAYTFDVNGKRED